MLNHNFKFIVCSSFLLLSISACDSGPQFADNETITANLGKPVTQKLNVKSWSNDATLVLTPGGPFVKNRFPLTQPVKFLSAMDNYVVTVDNTNQLSVIDFAKQPAKRVAQQALENPVTAIAIHDRLAIVGMRHHSLTVFDLSALPAIKKVAQLTDVKSINRIKVVNHKIHALTDERTLQVWEVTGTPVQLKLVNSIQLPAPTSDFDILDAQIIAIGASYGIGSLLLADPKQFQAVSSLQTKPRTLRVTDGIAYVADGRTGLVLFDVSEPGKLQWLGSHNKFDAIDDVHVSGERAFVLDHGLRIATLNISNKRLPITGSFYKPVSPISGFTARGDQVYLATKLGIEHVTFPASPHAQISNEGINQGGSRRAFIEKNIAYVADWFSGLHIYDISDPMHIRHLSNYHTPGSSKGVVVDNGYAFVGDDDHGLQIIDVRNPAQPVKVSEIMTTGLAYTLKKRRNLIYLADHRGGFHIIDVSDVNNPRLVSSYDTPGKSWAIDVIDQVAYVADDTTGLLIFDVSNAKNPRQIGQFNPGGAAEDVMVQNHLAYVSFFDKGLFILDISKPAQPAIVAQLPIPGNARSIDIENNYAYIAGWESGLNVVDISNPAMPQIVGHYDTKGSAWGADVSNGHAFIWDWWGGVLAVNVENPQQPQLAGKYHARGQIVNLRQKGNYIYTANGTGGVQVFDINNALNPIWVTGFDFPANVVDIWPSKQQPVAFAANAEHGLRVLDISNPFYIHAAGQYNTGGNAMLVREENNMVYVANKPSGLVIYNATDPDRLVKQRELALTVKDLWLDENRLLVASATQGLLSFSLDDAGLPTEQHEVIDTQVERVIASHSLIVSTTGDGEVKIWQTRNAVFQLQSTISVGTPVFDIQLSESKLLINSADKGLLSYDITDPAQPVLQARYPATDLLGRFIVSGDAIFFGGTHTIASVQQLAPLAWQQVDNTQLEVTIPATLEMGHYHLLITNPNGVEQLWPNAISVSLPQRKKPKMTMDDFKKLLEQHRSQQQ
jgi:hypothetical protein